MNRIICFYNIIGQDNDSWGYHSDGYFSGSGKRKPYGPLFTTGNTIGCCLNFMNNTVFYTKNGMNLGMVIIISVPYCYK